jgi:glycosyltransferase involved in cell wall biosynthesis
VTRCVARELVHVLVPEGVHDPRRPSGGNTYDRRLVDALGSAGWAVRETEVAGGWPWSARAGRAGLEVALRAVPDGSVVLVDGLLASRLPEVVLPAADRLRLVLLMHLPVGGPAERSVVHGAAAVVTPSDWCRTRVLDVHGADPARVHVAHPGVDAAATVERTTEGGRLLCVGAVTPTKGQDLLLAALGGLAELTWQCTCVGPDDLDPAFVAGLRREAHRRGVADRFLLTGPRTGGALDAAYVDADVLVVASRTETYGMVVTEALARGLPVVATAVGGVPEALGTTTDGTRPGVLVPPGDPAALADGLRAWLTDGRLRASLRTAALRRRERLTGWAITAERVGAVLRGVAA